MATNSHFISNRSPPLASGRANRSARPHGTPAFSWFGHVRRAFGLSAVVLCTVAAANGAAPAAPSPDEVALRLEQLASSGSEATVTFAAPDVLQRFYQQRGFVVAWDDAHAQAFVEVVRAADTQGLSPADYLVSELAALPPLSSLTGNARIDADLELTEALLRYAYHKRFGKVDPRELDTSWNYARSASAGGPYSALERIIAAPDLAAQLGEEIGHGAMYDGLQRVLARYRGYVAAGGWQEVPDRTDVEAGQRRCAGRCTEATPRRGGFRRAARR